MFKLATLTRASGFTLIEFIIALVILGIGSALLVSFVSPTAASSDPLIQAQARSIANAYMDEILLRQAGSGSCSGGRGNWEAVECYNGLSEPPHDQFGNPLASLGDYTVNVTAGGTITVNVSHITEKADLTLRSIRGSY